MSRLEVVVGALVALLLPSLLASSADTAGSVALGVLTLAIAALVRSGAHQGWLALRPHAAVCPTARDAHPPLAARVTDPVHHPLRPRAPGLA